MATIRGGDGPDSLQGTVNDPDDVDDTLLGLGGADTLAGLGGDDELQGDEGGDVLIGDAPLPPGPETPPPSGPLPGSNRVSGGPGDDRVWAGFGADTVSGGEGDDTINGFGLFGGSPSGALGAKGADGPDLLMGDEGNDSIDGGGGEDTIQGGTGDDTLAGDQGLDLLTGGPGGDVFALSRVPPFVGPGTGQGQGNRDVVADFEDGLDRFELRNFAPAFFQGPPVESVFLGTRPFEASFGLQVRYEVQDGDTILQIAPGYVGTPPEGTPPPSPASIAEVELTGAHRLTAGDFSGDGEPLVDRSVPPTPPRDEVDWDALAAEATANFEATGQWFPGQPVPPPPVDWDALAARITANFEATGQWFV